VLAGFALAGEQNGSKTIFARCTKRLHVLHACFALTLLDWKVAKLAPADDEFLLAPPARLVVFLNVESIRLLIPLRTIGTFRYLKSSRYRCTCGIAKESGGRGANR